MMWVSRAVSTRVCADARARVGCHVQQRAVADLRRQVCSNLVPLQECQVIAVEQKPQEPAWFGDRGFERAGRNTGRKSQTQRRRLNVLGLIRARYIALAVRLR